MGYAKQEPYIYQRLRTQGARALYLAHAIKALEMWSEQIFGAAIQLDEEELKLKIAEYILTERLSQHATHAIEVRLYANKEVEVVGQETLYLEPFPLRAIRPVATPHYITSDLALAPTSARDALLDICRTQSKLPSESIAMWIDHNNEITAIDGSPVVAVTNKEVIISRLGRSVEIELVERALSKTLHRTRRDAILYDNIEQYKELLYIDHRGIVALASIEGRPLSNIVAERIAKEVKKLENF